MILFISSATARSVWNVYLPLTQFLSFSKGIFGNIYLLWKLNMLIFYVKIFWISETILKLKLSAALWFLLSFLKLKFSIIKVSYRCVRFRNHSKIRPFFSLSSGTSEKLVMFLPIPCEVAVLEFNFIAVVGSILTMLLIS